MKQCFLCDDVLFGTDAQADGLTLCVDCFRIFNLVKLRLTKAAIEADPKNILQRDPFAYDDLFL